MPNVKLITVISTHLTLLFEHYPTGTAINLLDVILYHISRISGELRNSLIAILDVYFWSMLFATHTSQHQPAHQQSELHTDLTSL